MSGICISYIVFVTHYSVKLNFQISQAGKVWSFILLKLRRNVNYVNGPIIEFGQNRISIMGFGIRPENDESSGRKERGKEGERGEEEKLYLAWYSGM